MRKLPRLQFSETEHYNEFVITCTCLNCYAVIHFNGRQTKKIYKYLTEDLPNSIHHFVLVRKNNVYLEFCYNPRRANNNKLVLMFYQPGCNVEIPMSDKDIQDMIKYLDEHLKNKKYSKDILKIFGGKPHDIPV